MNLDRQAGVYTITCLPTGKQYVGSTTTSFRRRWAQHRHALRRGEGTSPKLLNAWRKYGPAAFEFRPMIVCHPGDALMYEQTAIDTLEPELNICATAGNCHGVRHGDAVRAHAVERANQQWASGQHSRDRLRAYNAARAKRYLVRGAELTIAEMVDRYRLKKVTIQARLSRGVAGDDLVASPQFERRVHRVAGVPMTTGEITAKFGLGEATVRYRFARGLRDDALIMPPQSGRLL